MRLTDARGYTLVEMLTVLAILSVVMGGLTAVFTSATNAEADMGRRFKAQQTARLALDKIRREVHCSAAAAPTNSTVSSVTLTVPGYCRTVCPGSSVCTSNPVSITWCTRSVATNRYALYRVVGATCTGGVKWADYLAPSSTASVCASALCVFQYTPPTATGCVNNCSLGLLHIDFPVNVKPAKSNDMYELVDDLVLRNTVRS